MIEESEKLLKAFGKNLEKIKKDKKLSYRKIAANCNVEHSDIKRYVDGKINPTLLSLVDLAKGLDVTLIELMKF